MTPEVIALVLTAVVHVVGAVFLVWAMLGDEDEGGLRGWWPRDDRGDDGPPGPPEPEAGPRGVPMPDAGPSPVRLRGPARLADGYEPPQRRPEHPREPLPAREPERA